MSFLTAPLSWDIETHTHDKFHQKEATEGHLLKQPSRGVLKKRWSENM